MWWLAGSACALYLVFLLGVLLTFVEALEYGASAAIIAVLALPILAGLLLIGSCAMAIRTWRGPGWRQVARAHYGLVLLAAVGYTLFLQSWNLLGFKL